MFFQDFYDIVSPPLPKLILSQTIKFSFLTDKNAEKVVSQKTISEHGSFMRPIFRQKQKKLTTLVCGLTH